MDFQQATLTICAAAVAYVWYKRYRTFSISDVPGPKNPSWIYGHLWWWQREGAGVVEERLLKEYGAVARWNGSLGEECLWIADPKAIHHILHTSGYLYEKPSNFMEMLAVLTDKGIASVEGDVHKRQRRAMAPAFGLVEAKALYPYFTRYSNSLADKWHEVISNGESGQSAIIDVRSWFGKATLDAVGAGAFDYDFGALENSQNKFTKSYTNLVFGSFSAPSKARLLMMDVLKVAPEGFVTWMMERSKRPAMVRLLENRTYTRKVAAKLIDDKRQELKDGTSRRDVLSLLVKANSALRQDWRLKDNEMVAQVRTIIFSGHETMARALTSALWELAKNRPVQERLRKEVTEALGRIKSRGKSDFTVEDLDSVPYLLAFGKEVLRMYPIAVAIRRVAKKNNILPLAKPIVGVSGKVHNELLVPAGTATYISIPGYHLNSDVWGQDADKFRPERWFDINEKLESPVGVYSNLATFSGGHRSCIGWRFAVIEMHTFLVTLVRQFDFSLPDETYGVKGMAMRSGVGEEDKGPHMLLKVTSLGSE